MKTGINISLCAFLLTISFLNKADASIQFSMRRMYVVTAETQEYVNYADYIYGHFGQKLRTSERFNYIPVDTVQSHLGAVLLADFASKIDIAKLLNLWQRIDLQAVFFFYLHKLNGDYHLHVEAVEFPSDVFLEELTIPLSLHPDDVAVILNQLESFVDLIQWKRQWWGYSFHAMEKGILCLTDDVKLPRLLNTLRGTIRAQSILSTYKQNELRSKVLYFDYEEWPLSQESADSLLRQTNAQALFTFTQQRDTTFLYFPTKVGRVSALENSLPLWLPYPGFQRFSIDADSSYGFSLGNGLFPQTYGAIRQLLSRWQQGDAARSLLLKNIQSIQNSQIALSTDDRRTLAELYQALAALYSESDREFGWIKLNHAALLKEMEQLEASLNASQAAFDNFQQFMNSYGRLFALLQAGATLEKLGHLDRAVETFGNALTFSQAIADEHTTAQIYFHLGSIKFSENKLIEAWDFFDSSADNFLQVGDTLRVVQLYTKLGDLMRQSNFLIKSQEYLERSVAFSRYLNDDRERADASYHLAVTLKERGEVDAALEYFQIAGDLMEILSDSIGLANSEEHIGDILFDRKQWIDAQQHFEYAARFYKYVPDIEGIIRSLIKSADAAVNRMRWMRAQSDYEEALQFATLYEKRDWISIILYKKGLAHVREGQLALGQEELELARQGDVSKEAIDAYMKSFIRGLEQELESRSQNSRP
ncbi:hypothetical protein JXA70_11145 [candidate division KSB1 bacterium]|nr:hypothetical protein [candidate division KSB1 bacterium]